ncbi:hypothetical protein Rsub_02152 [Raphidocelis subcapitata]|uniref:Uncharacterized protein n=1 Tax=Raphidocelis subcapitata TaxID=307507 RepID=A0A2V0NWT4_9CHLO|nr:hypothetical protein Rsub_02152 [Raphidocelis subcapitata]|eukprot:GBF89275.1 hypothetical protein Rsub_02152 [Raphidocelis subcapitata]
MRRDIHELQGPLEKNMKNKLRELLAEKALARSARKRVQKDEEAAAAAATAQAAALTAETTGIIPPTPVQARRTRRRETDTRRGFKDASLCNATKGDGEGEGGKRAAVFVPLPTCLPSRGCPAANYRSAAPATSFAAQWRAREFGAPATPARANPAPHARPRPTNTPVPAAVMPARPAWGRPIVPGPTPPPVHVLATSPAPTATGALASLSDAQLAAGAAFAAAAPLLTGAYAGVKTFSAALPAAKRLLAAGADALLCGVLPSGGAPAHVVAIDCDDAMPTPMNPLADGPPLLSRRSLRHQVTHGVAHLSGGVLSADSALARVAGSAAEAGAAAAVGLAVNAAAVGCAAAAAGVAATAAAIFTPPLFAGVSAFAGGRALWRALSGSRA